MAKCKRVLLLVHPRFRPDRGKREGTEFDVWSALRKLGFSTEVAAVDSDLRGFDRQLREYLPDVVFNLLEEFDGEAVFDFHLVSFFGGAWGSLYRMQSPGLGRFAQQALDGPDRRSRGCR
ncbi:MAG: hypothetical protein HC902_03305 [Calothrix sp. SM1_5_4]|nr:hypothetical protein [Calothrix sp. SM1_5_4]